MKKLRVVGYRYFMESPIDTEYMLIPKANKLLLVGCIFRTFLSTWFMLPFLSR